MDSAQTKTLSEKIVENISRVMMGKEREVRKVVICLFCAGHILLEDLPGTGKTTLAKALARSLECRFTRVQFTPDLLPSDLTGINFYNQKEGVFTFRPGAVFTHVLLGDEINRATPRTQSSLLECMEENQVTIDGHTYPLEKPFLVVATQNPIELQGTFPLPEAQLDRFFMRLSIGYPSKGDEEAMLARFAQNAPLETLEPVASKQDILAAQKAVRAIHVSEAVYAYIVAISQATREHDRIRIGVSPRGSLALLHGAQANAAMEARSFVTPDDVKAVCVDVLGHRIAMRGSALSRAPEAAAELLRQILTQIPVPTEEG